MTDKTESLELKPVVHTWKVDTTDGRTEYISSPYFRLCTTSNSFQFYDQDEEGVSKTKALFTHSHVISIVKLIK